MTLREFLKSFNFSNPNWENLPKDFPNCDLEGLESDDVGKFLGIKTLWELYQGQLREAKGKNTPNFPFRIPVIEKTTRQAQNMQGYKASAYWQTASLLRDLVQLLLRIITEKQFRRKTQLEDASRSMVSTFEEGWARPSTKEFLDYSGFGGASLTEVRGDVERLFTDGYLPTYEEITRKYGNSREQLKVPTPSRNFPYPPVKSRKFPTKYGKLRERLREFTGHEVRPENLSYELLIEFVNKSDYLLRRAVEGLRNKVIREEKQKLKDEIRSHSF